MTGTMIMGWAAVGLLGLVGLVCLLAALSSAWRRDWRFAQGAAVMAAIFLLGAASFLNSALTGRNRGADAQALRLR